MRRNPLQTLRYLPWLPLLTVAALTLIATFVLEILLVLAISFSPLANQALNLLFAPPLGLLMVMAIGLGAGAIAVWILETLRQDVVINAGVLWALVACLMLLVALRQLIPGAALVNPDQPTLIGIVLGVFFRGRRHWRY